jgi:hypothetical protein
MKTQVWHLDAVIIACLMLIAAGAMAVFIVGLAGGEPSGATDPREQKEIERLDADGAKTAKTPEGQRRVSEIIAKQFKVDKDVVTGLRNEKMGWGEVAITLALSQEVMKKQGLTQDAALKAILDKRRAGEGWGRIAQDYDLKLGRVISEVKRADKGVERIDHAKPEKIEKVEKAERPERPEKAQRVERPEKPERGR